MFATVLSQFTFSQCIVCPSVLDLSLHIFHQDLLSQRFLWGISSHPSSPGNQATLVKTSLSKTKAPWRF